MNEEFNLYLDEISIRSILRDFLKNWWMFVLAAMTAVLLLSSYENLVHEEYFTSSATLVVSAKGKGSTDAYADLTITSGMAKVFSDIFSSNALRELVAKKLDVSPSAFSVQANIIPETNLLVVKVTGDNPRTVYQAIKGVLENCTEVSDYVFSNAVMDVLQHPTVAQNASNTFSAGRYQKIAVAGAILLMAGLIGVLSVLRDTVKTGNTARRKIKGKRLALIGHEVKNRTLKAKLKSLTKAILITNPTTSFGYLESFRKLSFRIHSDMSVKKQKILLITSIRENEGKSTVASNIALALVQSGKNVVLADLDLRRPSIYKIFDSTNTKNSGLWRETCQLNGAQRLELILNRTPVRKPMAYLKKLNLDALFEPVLEQADYIIIDSPPVSVAADTEYLLEYADAVLLVVRQDCSYVTEINNFIELMKTNDIDFLGYVLNDFENQNPLGRKQYKYHYGKYYEKYGYTENGI